MRDFTIVLLSLGAFVICARADLETFTPILVDIEGGESISFIIAGERYRDVELRRFFEETASRFGKDDPVIARALVPEHMHAAIFVIGQASALFERTYVALSVRPGDRSGEYFLLQLAGGGEELTLIRTFLKRRSRVFSETTQDPSPNEAVERQSQQFEQIRQGLLE